MASSLLSGLQPLSNPGLNPVPPAVDESLPLSASAEAQIIAFFKRKGFTVTKDQRFTTFATPITYHVKGPGVDNIVVTQALLVTDYEALKAGGGFGNAGTSSFPNPFGSVTDFLALLANGNTWVRVGEVVLGLLILGVGVNAALKHNDAYKSVTGTVKKVGKVAAL